MPPLTLCVPAGCEFEAKMDSRPGGVPVQREVRGGGSRARICRPGAGGAAGGVEALPVEGDSASTGATSADSAESRGCGLSASLPQGSAGATCS